MARVTASIAGKLGFGKSTLINNVFGQNVAQTSDNVACGCTTEITPYGPLQVQGRTYTATLYDTEGMFGAADDIGEVVSKLSGKLNGQPLNVMACTISVQHISRVDQDVLTALSLCAGILGDMNVERLTIIFTYCDDDAAKAKAREIFAGTMVIIDNIMKKGKGQKFEKMKALGEAVKNKKIDYVTVSKTDVSGVLSMLDAFGAMPPISVTPEQWTTDPEQVEQHVKNIWQLLGEGLLQGLEALGKGVLDFFSGKVFNLF